MCRPSFPLPLSLRPSRSLVSCPLCALSLFVKRLLPPGLSVCSSLVAPLSHVALGPPYIPTWTLINAYMDLRIDLPGPYVPTRWSAGVGPGVWGRPALGSGQGTGGGEGDSAGIMNVAPRGHSHSGVGAK